MEAEPLLFEGIDEGADGAGVDPLGLGRAAWQGLRMGHGGSFSCSLVYIGEAMPDEPIDAGRIDGASDYSIFFRVGLRIIRPGLVTLFLIVFVSTWNNFFLPLVMLNKTSLYPVTLGLQIWSTDLSSAGSGEPLYPLIIIGAFISILPMLILFPILRRYIVSGITLGSVK